MDIGTPSLETVGKTAVLGLLTCTLPDQCMSTWQHHVCTVYVRNGYLPPARMADCLATAFLYHLPGPSVNLHASGGAGAGSASWSPTPSISSDKSSDITTWPENDQSTQCPHSLMRETNRTQNPGRGNQRNSPDGFFRRGRRWVQTGPRRLWPFSRRNREITHGGSEAVLPEQDTTVTSPEQVYVPYMVQWAKAAATRARLGLRHPDPLLVMSLQSSVNSTQEQQLEEGEPHIISTSVAQVHRSNDVSYRPAESVAPWASGDLGPVDDLSRSPLPEPPRVWRRARPPTPYRLRRSLLFTTPNFPRIPPLMLPRVQRTPSPKPPRLTMSESSLQQGAHANQTEANHLEPKEAELKEAPAPAQEAEPAPAPPEEHLEEPAAQADLEADPELERCLTPVAFSPYEVLPGAAMEVGPASTAPPAHTEVGNLLPEEASDQPALTPPTQEELCLHTTSGPAQEPPVQSEVPSPSEGSIFPPLFDYFLLFSVIIIFPFSPWPYRIFYIINFFWICFVFFYFVLFLFLLTCFFCIE
ncbi:uncharacterized protein [Saccopteryx bilineata]|uniref:uncharacterized protein n=1 Tax=Saccopteryx bilineata TaxID=59482 RepID=UPI00338D913D